LELVIALGVVTWTIVVIIALALARATKCADAECEASTRRFSSVPERPGLR
jgi:hypothetical protein